MTSNNISKFEISISKCSDMLHGSQDHCVGVLNDNNGNLWISTNQGLSRFNPKTEQFKNYSHITVSNSIPDNHSHPQFSYSTLVTVDDPPVIDMPTPKPPVFP